VYNRFPQDPRVRREALALARQGYDVHVLCVRGGDEPDEELWNNIQIHRIPLRAIRGGRCRYIYQYAVLCLMFAVRLFTLAFRYQFAILHVHSLPDILVFVALPTRFLGAKVVLDLHESMPELYLARFPRGHRRIVPAFLLAAQRLSCAVADRAITVNEYLRSLLARRGTPAERITVLANAPDWAANGRAPYPNALSGLPEIIVVGGLNPERDHPLVLRAAKVAHEEVPFRLRIIGYGDLAYSESLRRLIGVLGIADWASIESEVPPEAVQALLRRTSFGIVSYKRNPLTEMATPNKVYEYAASGKAMVVADLPALRQLLGDAALFYEPGDADSLASQMIRLLQDPVERDRLAARASEIHHAHLWTTIEERLITLYSDLLASRPAPPSS